MNPKPENGGFILNRFKIQSVTASSEVTGYEIEKAFTKFPTEIYKSSSNSIIIKMTYVQPIQATGFALINHNLTVAALGGIGYYSDANFSTLIFEKSISHASPNTYLIIDDAPTCKYIKLSIIDTNLSQIQIGCIYAGESFQFPYNYQYGLETEFAVLKQVDTSDEGIHFETPDEDSDFTAPEYHQYNMTFSDLDKQYFYLYQGLIRPGKKVFIPSFTKLACYFGIVPAKKLKSVKERTKDTFTLSFWEDALGGQSD